MNVAIPSYASAWAMSFHSRRIDYFANVNRISISLHVSHADRLVLTGLEFLGELHAGA
jgi:hypothetical protein